MRRLSFLFALLCSALLACDDDPAPSDGGGGGAGAGGAAAGGDGGGGAGGSAPACTEFADPHLQLLNAPTTAQVEHKVPTHPPVGPEGLP